MKQRREPDHEAVDVDLTADQIEKKGYFRRSKTDGGNYAVAKGNIEVKIRKQHPGSKDKETRPDVGTVLTGDGSDREVTVAARRIEKVRKNGSGRDNTTASGGVEIFGKLRRGKS